MIHSALNSTKSHRSKIDIGIVWTPPPKGDICIRKRTLRTTFSLTAMLFYDYARVSISRANCWQRVASGRGLTIVSSLDFIDIFIRIWDTHFRLV